MSESHRLLFIGDVVGEGGVEAVSALTPKLREELELDAVIANGENSSAGRGINRATCEALLEHADFLTLGDHAFDDEEARELLEEEPRVVRPANFNRESPGAGWGMFEAGGRSIGVLNLQGRVFMREVSGSPFDAADVALSEIEQTGVENVIVDFHAEATAEKQALGYYLEGRAVAVIGTHTHIQTADERVLPGGTAYITDVGMVGGMEGIIGFDREDFLGSILEGNSPKGDVQQGPVEFCAAVVELDEQGRAVELRRIRRELRR